MSDHIVVFITTGSLKEAETIAYTLVEEKLAACVNIWPSVRSIFRWEGEVHKEHESFLMAKTHRNVLPHLTQRVLELHSYDTPQVIALPIEAGSSDYLQWIKDQVQHPLAVAS